MSIHMVTRWPAALGHAAQHIFVLWTHLDGLLVSSWREWCNEDTDGMRHAEQALEHCVDTVGLGEPGRWIRVERLVDHPRTVGQAHSNDGIGPSRDPGLFFQSAEEYDKSNGHGSPDHCEKISARPSRGSSAGYGRQCSRGSQKPWSSPSHRSSKTEISARMPPEHGTADMSKHVSIQMHLSTAQLHKHLAHDSTLPQRLAIGLEYLYLDM